MVHSCIFVNTHKQAHKVNLSLLQKLCRTADLLALLVAELHKGGVISFRITQRKSDSAQIDFLEWKHRHL